MLDMAQNLFVLMRLHIYGRSREPLAFMCPKRIVLFNYFELFFDFIAPHVSLITETNVPHNENVSYFGDGTNEARMVYNFALPPLTLHAIQTGKSEQLTQWAQSVRLPSREVTFFNFLASHDGIGLNPARGILSEDEMDTMVSKVETIRRACKLQT
jgi:glucosylglycerate phosphorylase